MLDHTGSYLCRTWVHEQVFGVARTYALCFPDTLPWTYSQYLDACAVTGAAIKSAADRATPDIDLPNIDNIPFRDNLLALTIYELWQARPSPLVHPRDDELIELISRRILIDVEAHTGQAVDD